LTERAKVKQIINQRARARERIKPKTQETEWNKRYFESLNGILSTQKSNDEYAFVQNLGLNNENELRNIREFLRQSGNKIYADYDRRFFLG